MIKSFEIKLDIEKELYSRTDFLFSISGSDVDSVELQFQISQDEAAFDLTGTTVQLAVKKPSGYVHYQDCTITNAIEGQANCVLSSLGYNEQGIHIAEVYIKTLDQTAVTCPFYFKSREAMIQTASVGTPAEWGTITGDISLQTDLQTALGGKADDVHSHTFAEITEKPTAYPAEAHTHAIADVTNLQLTLDGKADDAHSHTFADITLKPATYPPDAHSHTFAEITAKPLTYPPDAHSHAYADITAKPTTFPPEAHSHAIADVTGLQLELDSKLEAIPAEYLTETEGDARYKAAGSAPEAHTHTEADLTFGTKNAKVYVDDADNYILGRLGGLSFWKGTQTEYDAIATKDPNTIYFVV